MTSMNMGKAKYLNRGEKGKKVTNKKQLGLTRPLGPFLSRIQTVGDSE